MAEERYSLKAAAELYGVKPNAIRARFKKGQIRGERNNQGQIFVWVDPAQAANDKRPEKPSLKHSNSPEKSGELKALKDHIETLTNERDRLRAEVDRLHGHIETLLRGRDEKIAELESALESERRRGLRGLWYRLIGK